MKPFWQYWVETIIRTILIIIACCAVILFAGWLVATIGGKLTLTLVCFLAGTFVIAVIWSVFDNDPEHMKPWFYKGE